MIDDDLRQRARRLLAGQHRNDDLDRLYLGQRTRSWSRPAFREIGDFVAHRDVRDQGLFSQTTRDVFTSFDVWSLGLRNRKPTVADIIRAAYANLRLANDAQIKAGCGCQRGAAKKRLDSGFAKVERQDTVSPAELRVIEYLGNRLIWRPAFSADQLVGEFGQVLSRNNIISVGDLPALESAKAFITLHAMSTMHGSSIDLQTGAHARLYAGYANKDRWLEVKVELTYSDFPKPVWAPICLFLTDLQPEPYCDPVLVLAEDPVLFSHWTMPLEVSNERLSPVG